MVPLAARSSISAGSAAASSGCRKNEARWTWRGRSRSAASTHRGGAERGDGARQRQDGPVARLRENHGQAGGEFGVDGDRGDIHSCLDEAIEREGAELVVADHRGQRRPHAEPREPARHDRRTSPKQQIRRVE